MKIPTIPPGAQAALDATQAELAAAKAVYEAADAAYSAALDARYEAQQQCQRLAQSADLQNFQIRVARTVARAVRTAASASQAAVRLDHSGEICEIRALEIRPRSVRLPGAAKGLVAVEGGWQDAYGHLWRKVTPSQVAALADELEAALKAAGVGP